MTRTRRIRRWLAGGAIALAAAALAAAAALQHTASGYPAAVFSPDGRSVYAIVREVRGTVVGLGFQSLTPPASVWIHRDRFSVQRIDIATGRSDVLYRFPPSPLEGVRLSQYRGSLFTVPRGGIRATGDGRLDAEMVVTRPAQPSGTEHVARLVWDTRRDAAASVEAWSPGAGRLGGDDDALLSGERELIAVPGDQGMPCGLALYEAEPERVTFVAGAAACADAHGGSMPLARIRELSRRPQIERQQTIRRTYDDLVKGGVARGLTDGEARLAAIREMQRLGYYPKPTQLIARRVAPGEIDPGLPRVEIDAMEFTVGLFPDILEAVERPGEPVDKTPGRYIVHRDYDTSERINALLDSGARRFLVTRGDETYEVRIERD